jgi:hypothetical protein
MPTLHIEHPITDLDTWLSAFNRFAEIRRTAGVRSELVRRPVDDPRSIVIDLDFGTIDEATAFLDFLTGQVWGNRENSPGLAGDPVTTILQPVETSTPVVSGSG